MACVYRNWRQLDIYTYQTCQIVSLVQAGVGGWVGYDDSHVHLRTSFNFIANEVEWLDPMVVVWGNPQKNQTSSIYIHLLQTAYLTFTND